jgi:hypothetical protein
MQSANKEETGNNIFSAITHAFKRNGYTPRNHQVKTIVKIVGDLASYEHTDKGKVRNYLIQQAAGSGKSRIIQFLLFFQFLV